MLSIGKLAAGQAKYYLEQAEGRVDVVESVGAGLEDYYSGGAEARGEWIGIGTRRLGLGGAVDGTELRHLLGGEDPWSGEPLRGSRSPVRVAGFDLTFSAPKSVSVLFGTGDRRVERAIRGGHDRAVLEAVSYLERSAAAVRRGRAGAEVVEADGLIAAAFRHRTSRAGDPQLHSHVLVANLARGADGRWSALDGRRLYSHARAASFIYQAVLRSELTRSLGVEWSSVHQGIGEIRGVPVAVMRAFSRRRANIEAALEARGASGPRAAEAAALATRERKRAVEPSRLSAEWRRRALAAGMPEHGLLVGRGGPVHVDEDTWARIAAELVRRDGLTSARSTFSRRDVIQELCDRLPAGATVDARALEGGADRVLASPEIIALLPANSSVGERESFRRRDGRRLPVDREEFRFTTAELLATERRVISAAEDRRDVGAGRAGQQHLDGAMAARPTLSGEQRAMVRSLLLDGARIAVVAGHAGTGKTFALDAAREAWAAAGYEVLGAAVARRAALELQADAGIPSTSVTALLASLRRRALPPRAVVVLDEASMVGTRQLAALLDHVQRADAKLVLVGDHCQLPELAAGGAFRGMVRRGFAVELRENRRQARTWERAAVEHLRNGRVGEALAAYDAHGRLTVAPSLDDAKQRLVADWWAARAGEDAVMIAARRSEVTDLNTRAREHMRAAGRLGHEELRLPAGRFAAGDRVVIKHNDQALGVANGERGTVVDVDPRERTLDLALADGRRVRLDRRFLRSRTRTGDPTLTHGYAITGHVAQGMTTDRAFVLAAEGLSSEWGYTALTRGRESNHLYVAEGAPARDEFAPRGIPRNPLEQLERDLCSRRGQSLALDAVGDELAGLPQARWAATQDLWASQTRRTLAEHRARWRPGRRRALRHAVDAEDAAQRRLTQLEEREDQLTQLVATRPIRHEPPGRGPVYREPLALRATGDIGREL